MVKRVNVLIPDEMHKALRIKLAEDGANFSDWLRAKITEYAGEKETKGKYIVPGIRRPGKKKGA